MRELAPPPFAVVDTSGTLRVGSFRGPLPSVDFSRLGRSRLFRLAHHKRWIYSAIVTDELFLASAILDLGYAASTFAFAFDKKAMRMLADKSALGPPFAGSVGDTMGEGCRAAFRFGSTEAMFSRPYGSGHYGLSVAMPDFLVEASISAPPNPPPVAAVVALPGGCGNATEKRVFLPVTGDALIAGRRFSLDGGVAGYDYTHGYLARHTAWRWAFAMGRAVSGEAIGLNLVGGFNGSGECAVWVGDEVIGVGEGRFEFNPSNPLAPWRVTTADGAVDLEFTPGAMHAEHKNLGIVKSRFVQPVGLYHGEIRLPGRTPLRVENLLGVAEDQDVLW